MYNDSIIAKLHNAFNATTYLFKGYNPLEQHLFSAHRAGASYFDEGIKTIDDLLDLVQNNSMDMEMQPGRDGAINFIFHMKFGVNGGTKISSRPIPGNMYVMRSVHGELQPVGKTVETAGPSQYITICLTPELDKTSGNKVFCLASCYPGMPDMDWDKTDLKEGSTLTGGNLIERGCERVKGE